MVIFAVNSGSIIVLLKTGTGIIGKSHFIMTLNSSNTITSRQGNENQHGETVNHISVSSQVHTICINVVICQGERPLSIDCSFFVP